MRKAKTFVKKTKKGNVLNIVGEHYLRDDIGCGFVVIFLFSFIKLKNYK